ncbi:unnamed protein product [Brassica rapa]|uniref:Uncharacterized protein n=2 Tax=Brassica TaxID=3705 RepID=A0A3P6AWW9_BRACM|nr:unnamed protein product [Brassica napus]CAG7900696.1 unnamed protein product [Brassica rapa]CDY38152.1 BnaA07g02310D [Brassica napus]VDC95577.1 unnamed protein product [Brassica rapa]
MVHYLKVLATKVVNLIVDSAHVHIIQNPGRYGRQGRRFDIGGYWKETSYEIAKYLSSQLAPEVDADAEGSIISGPDNSLTIVDYTKEVSIFCNPSVLTVRVRDEEQREYEHSVNSHTVNRFLGLFHEGSTMEEPETEIELTIQEIAAIKKKTFPYSFEAKARVSELQEKLKSIGKGQRRVYLEQRRYLSARVDHLTEHIICLPPHLTPPYECLLKFYKTELGKRTPLGGDDGASSSGN